MGSDATQFLVDPLNIRENVFGGGQDQPNLTTYGGGMKEALEAQLALLTGKKVGEADFTSVGKLEDLLPIEKSLREKSAQVETDVLRKTMLGGQTGGQTQEVTYDEQGRVISGYSEPGEAKIRAVIEDSDGNIIPNAGDPNVVSDAQRVRVEFVDANGNVIDQSDDLPITSQTQDTQSGPLQTRLGSTLTNLTDQLISNLENNPNFDQETLDRIKTERSSIPGFDQKTMMGSEGYDGYGLNKNQNSYAITDAQPIFAKDAQGNIITDISKAGTTETTTIPVQRTGDGMIDLLGDKREVQGMRPDFEQYVRNNPDYMAEVARDNAMREANGLPTRSLEEWGRAHYAREGEAKGDIVPETFGSLGRTAGFSQDGEFLGASAFAEDLARGNISRQRQQDLDDVSRFAGQYQDIMEQFRDPNTPRTIGEIGGANDVFLNAIGGNAGAGAEATQPTGPGLRAMLASQATEALGQGLTDRERQRIQDSFKGQATMMGRTFDQSAGIREAEALVGESNQRKMQNRAFAQNVLGQEAALRQAEIAQAKADELDPFRAILGRSGGNSLQQAQGVLGQSGYGLQSGLNYLNPESGLGFIQNQNTNLMNMYNAQQQADAERFSGLTQAATTAAMAACWVAREVYGVNNPAWMSFRYWMLNESPSWFRATYLKFGERFARFISDKPRLKARIRMWMDSKIGR